MAAQSATGTGTGASNKFTTKELSVLANGLNILEAGRIQLITPPSPPTAIVKLTNTLPGSYTDYTVLITGLSTGAIYIESLTNDDDGNFSEFRVVSESEGYCMYVVTRCGINPTV